MLDAGFSGCSRFPSDQGAKVLTHVSNSRRNFQASFTAFLTFLVVLAFPAMLSGQTYSGTVSGELTDPSRAVVAGVKVVLTDEQKGFTFNAVSDSSGRYLFRSISPGIYSVSVEAKGFEKAVRTNIKLDVNQNAEANLSLQMASTTQTVQVNSQGQTIDVEDAVTGQVINRKFINDLPLIDRNVMNLAYLAPGVTDVDDNCPNSDPSCNGTNFVSNGSRGSTADILLDGASITNFEPNGGITAATYQPSPEAVEEFKVQQSNFSAEFGFSGASVINMVTRSGANKFHGSGYDFLRNQITDANTWFNNHYGAPIAALSRNDYGVTFGGPIIKNKTFFFFDYERLRETAASSAQAGVPSALMRTGDFGEICPANGGAWDSTVGTARYGQCVQPGDITQPVQSGQIYDPYSGTYNSTEGGADRSTFIPFNNLAQYSSPGSPNLPANLEPGPGNGNLIDPVAQKMLNLFPMPNIAGGTPYDNWYGSGSNRNFNDQFDIKVDHRFSEKNLLSVKYSQQWSHNLAFNCFKNFIDPCAGGPNRSTAHLFAINDTHTISPTLLLNVQLGFTRGALRISAYNPQGVSDPLGALGFPSYLGSSGFTGVPATFIGGQYLSAGYTSAGGDPYGNYKQGQDTVHLSATLDKVYGAHEMKFGFEGRLHQQNYIQTSAPEGIFSFDQNGTSACTALSFAECGGDGLASFLTGQLNANSYYEIQFEPATENYQYGTFAQDNWKVSHKLTLNLGLRYDVSLPRTDRHNRQNWFDPNVASPLNGGSLTFTDPISLQPATRQLLGGEVFAGAGHRKNYATDWSDIQPRFGFAYQFAPRMVLRGGYGVYFGQSRSGASGVVPYGSQGFNQYTNVIPTYNNDNATPYLHLNNPYPNGLNQPNGSSLGLLNDVGYQAIGPLRTGRAARTPNEQSWSLGIERELPWNVVLNVEYLGKKGTHLPFSGSNQLNILGPQIESYSSAQIAQLNTVYQNPPNCNNSPNSPDPCNPFFGIITDPNSALSSAIQGYQLEMPYPQFSGVATDVQMIANSTYHALQLSAEKRYSNGLQFLTSFTWSKSIDDSSLADDNVNYLGSFTSLQDPNKPWLERSLSTFDIPAVLQFSYSYDLPIGRGKKLLGNMPHVVDLIVGGWKTSGVWRVADGRPLSFALFDGASLPTYGAQRPNLVGKPRRFHGSDWIDHYFANPEVLQKPDVFTLGNAPRATGSVRTPFAFNTELSVGKEFPLKREGMNVEVRLEAYNAFNHPVFGAPNTTVDDAQNFGIITYTSNGPRQVQLAFKFNF